MLDELIAWMAQKAIFDESDSVPELKKAKKEAEEEAAAAVSALKKSFILSEKEHFAVTDAVYSTHTNSFFNGAMYGYMTGFKAAIKHINELTALGKQKHD